MVSIRRLSDKTLAKYQQIIEEGGELTPRQQRALQGHALITNETFVTALLRPDLLYLTDNDRASADDVRAAYGDDAQPPRRPVDDGRWA